MGVGGGGGVNFVVAGDLDHVQKLGLEVRFALEVEGEVHQVRAHLFHYFLEKTGIKFSRGSCKRSETTGALGTPQAAGRCRLNGHADWQAREAGFPTLLRKEITAPNLRCIYYPFWR